MKTNINSLFKCNRCDLNFLSKEGMEKHYMRVHEGKGVVMTKFKCDKCDSEFHSKQEFKNHKNLSNEPCAGCKTKGKVFIAPNKCELAKHVNVHKAEEVKSGISCNKCKLNFKSIQQLKIHKKQRGELTCRKIKCGRTFFGTCSLEKHMRFDPHKSGSGSALKNKPVPIAIKPAMSNLLNKLKSSGSLVGSKPKSGSLNEHNLISDIAIESKPNSVSAIESKPDSGSLIGSKLNLLSTIESKPILQNGKTVIKENKKTVSNCSDLIINSPIKAKEEFISPNLSFIEASKLVQSEAEKHHKMVKLTENISFHYETATELQLVNQGVFDETSSISFLPPFLTVEEENLVDNADKLENEIVIEHPDTCEGVSILGC